MAGRGHDPGGKAAQRLRARDLVRAGEVGTADRELARLDQVVEAEADTAVLTDADGRNGVVGLRAFEAVHLAPLNR